MVYCKLKGFLSANIIKMKQTFNLTFASKSVFILKGVVKELLDFFWRATGD